MKKHDAVLWLLFGAFLFIRFAMKMTYWMALAAMACGIAMVLLAKNKMPSKKYIILSAVLALLAVAGYLGYERTPAVLLYGLTAGFPTLLTSLAVFAVMEQRGGFVMLTGGRKYAAVGRVALGLAVGAVLAVMNLYLPGEGVTFAFSPWGLLLALNPAVFEEMALRAVFMAYCVHYARGEKMNTLSVLTMYVMMIVPHAVGHGYDVGTTLVLAVLFGLPLTLLQRKCGIASAMICHGVVDAVRFSLIGV